MKTYIAIAPTFTGYRGVSVYFDESRHIHVSAIIDTPSLDTLPATWTAAIIDATDPLGQAETYVATHPRSWLCKPLPQPERPWTRSPIYPRLVYIDAKHYAEQLQSLIADNYVIPETKEIASSLANDTNGHLADSLRMILLLPLLEAIDNSDAP